MTEKLANYIGGAWVEGAGAGTALVDPVLGTELVRASTAGLDYRAGLEHARTVGGPALRALSYAERAALVGKIADVLAANREDYYRIALENSGNTATDAQSDIDGGIFTLRSFARAGAALGEGRYLLDGPITSLSKDGTFAAVHLAQPLRGVAVHINAFNFPSWGLWEKAGPTLLSGVPIFAKPATATSWLTQRMVKDVVEAGILPDGALSVVCGSAGDLLDHLQVGDVVSFTGSADTGMKIRGNPTVLHNNCRVNIEADSLNSTVLGPDATPGAAEFDLLVKEVVREMTHKAGQKCTAIRRIIVPARIADDVADAVAARLAKTTVGNPRTEGVRMGPVVSLDQKRSCEEGLAALRSEAAVVYAGGDGFAPVDADPEVSAFLPPTLLSCADPDAAQAVHDVEVFGPASTILPYRDPEHAFALAARGLGSLASSVFSGDAAFIEAASLALAGRHGRVLNVNESVGSLSTGHGNVMPQCIHGGPGRAGGGEELGGLRALRFYHQLAAIQGPLPTLEALAAGGATLSY